MEFSSPTINDLTKCPVSVIIPTKNEERNIASCIKSIDWCREIIVYDSQSSDHTLAIAAKLGAKIVQKSFDNFSGHKNWALDNVPLQYDWVLLIDADERISLELKNEIFMAIKNERISGYYVPRMNIFMGKWIRHGGWYPDYQLRLFRRGKARFDGRIVHEHMVINTATQCLVNPIVHHDCKGLERYFERHNKYSSLEAVEALRAKSKHYTISDLIKGLLTGGPRRRRNLKEIAYKFLPCRCLFKFFWMYFMKFGILDGRPGFRFCILHAFYEYQVSLKLEELDTPHSPMNQDYKKYM